MASDKPLKAYKVLEDCESTGGIVFAKSNAQARRLGAEEHADGDFFGVTCKRAPQFDKFAERGFVTPLDLYFDGWWHHCANCETKLADGEYLDDDEDKPQPTPILHKGELYCDHWCVLKDAERRAGYRRDKALAVTMARLSLPEGCQVLSGFTNNESVEDGTFVDDTYGRAVQRRKYRTVVHYCASFTFPGGQHPGRWDHKTPETVHVSQIDLEAWQRFRGRTQEVENASA